jgi:very-short-patch-repair endonuclease
MILSEKVEVKISRSNITYYKQFYPDIKINTTIEIDVDKIYKYSKSIIHVKCDVCGVEKYLAQDMYYKNIKKYNFYSCSRKCSQEKVKLTSLERYGVDNPAKSDEIKNKIKEVNNLKFDCDYSWQNEEIKNKIKETIKERYGTEHHLQNKEILDKLKKTNLEKYGFEFASQNIDIKDKISKNIKEYYRQNSFILYESLVSVDDNFFVFHCNECNNDFEIEKSLYHNRKYLKNTICTICNPYNNQISDFERQLSNFIVENTDEEILLKNKDIIKPYELDIYLPNLKIAFEFNGLYWHNELHKMKNYHKDKSDLCEKKGIQLIHIWEDDWLYKNEIIKSMILNKLGKTTNRIFARKCIIKEVSDNTLIKDFLNNNHIQGFIGSNIKIGLFFDNILLSLMTFGNKRNFMNSNKDIDSYEMLRFCNIINTNVVGGASKLFKYFIKNYKPKEIITYADRSYSNGNIYTQLGFNFICKTQPNYYYITSKKRYHRYNFRKDVLVKEGYDKNLSEHQIMLGRNIYRIYNSGNFKFIYSS